MSSVMVYMIRAICFLRLGVVVKLHARPAVGTNVVGVGGVAGIAVDTERAGPAFHDLVDLLSGCVLRQYLEVRGRGEGARHTTAAGRRTLRGLGDSGNGEDGCG